MPQLPFIFCPRPSVAHVRPTGLIPTSGQWSADVASVTLLCDNDDDDGGGGGGGGDDARHLVGMMVVKAAHLQAEVYKCETLRRGAPSPASLQLLSLTALVMLCGGGCVVEEGGGGWWEEGKVLELCLVWLGDEMGGESG
ncbi:unnamed protein product [Hydatigera taeniaeformis]|uniref:Uncharacterized protein n=1 Tax=Hydatigena taeniaeformis TaxID=6205 RepID=A0A0R3XAY3_HYDTA|nr:unnamed protein product [Hydatigera taeniaeformis]